MNDKYVHFLSLVRSSKSHRLTICTLHSIGQQKIIQTSTVSLLVFVSLGKRHKLFEGKLREAHKLLRDNRRSVTQHNTTQHG